jgi:hypothetical protein
LCPNFYEFLASPYLSLSAFEKKTSADAKVKQATAPRIIVSLVQGRPIFDRRDTNTKIVRSHSIVARTKAPCTILAGNG